ncbi:MAG: MBL fold metallo-hydrolase [Candidatus Omnitrophota bacterium]
MRIIIHRGTEEIGGSCIELVAERSRILIDPGVPFPDDKEGHFDPKALEGRSLEELKGLKLLPDIKGLYKGEAKEVDAIFLSHSYLGHYGLLKYLSPDIPVYMSKGAGQLIKISDIFTPDKAGPINAKILSKNKRVSVGAFSVTPYIVDHPAFDARAFLIEAGNKRLFYSGDSRGHGRKSALFNDMANKPPADIDCLLIGGSMLGRDHQLYETEEAVQAKITKILKKAANISFLFASYQNTDRSVSAYKACLRTNSILIIDIYTAFILDNLRKVSTHIAQFDLKNIRIRFLKQDADVLADAGYRNLLFAYNRRKIDIFEINRKKKDILMLTGDNSDLPGIFKDIDGLEGAKIIYSMWEGHQTDKFKQYCARKGLDIEQVHTSGYAAVEDLKAFASAISPKTLIPINVSEGRERPEIFENEKILKAGELYEV